MSWLIILIYVAVLLFAAAHVLLHRRDARSSALWLILLVVLPGLGMLLYALLGLDRIRRKALIKEAATRHIREEYAALLLPNRATVPYAADQEGDGSDSSPAGRSGLDFYPALERLCARPLLAGNQIRLLTHGDQVYQLMLAAIEQAQHNVNLETYIINPDRVGRQLIELMVKKANEGVEIRLLFDSIGSVRALWFLDELQHTRVKAHEFAPINPLKRRFQVNLRNHRKLLLVDGQLAFTGGMNINEAHLIDHPLLTRVKDNHFLIEGPVVEQMQECFVEDWYYATGESLLKPAFFPPLEWRGDDLTRLITSGPDGDFEAFYHVLMVAVGGARQHIYIVSPYFIPDHGLLTALRLAAARGVEITLVVPGHSDHPFVTFASRTYYDALLEAGIRIYERRAPFLHAKVMIVDGQWVCIGSANMDIRSFRLNFEANLEVRSARLAARMQDAVQEEIAQSQMMDLATFRSRSLPMQLVEHACSLFSPLL